MSGGELNTLMTEQRDSFYSVAFSADGSRIVTGSYDTVEIWDAMSGGELKSLIGHTDSINSVAFSIDGSRIVTGSSDGTAKIWEVDAIHFRSLPDQIATACERANATKINRITQADRDEFPFLDETVPDYPCSLYFDDAQTAQNSNTRKGE